MLGRMVAATFGFYLWLIPESARFMVVRKYPSARIARTMRRVVGSDVTDTATFTSVEPSVQGGAPAKALLSPSYRKITLSLWSTYFMGLLVIYLLSGWLPTLIKDAGLSIESAANLTALFQLGGTVGALVVGYLMDRWTPNKVIASAYLAGAIFILLLATGSVKSSMFAAFVLLAGFCMSGAQTDRSVPVARYWIQRRCAAAELLACPRAPVSARIAQQWNHRQMRAYDGAGFTR